MCVKKLENRKEIYDESDWSDPEAVNAYPKSKIYAEKAAWEFVNTLPDD